MATKLAEGTDCNRRSKERRLVDPQVRADLMRSSGNPAPLRHLVGTITEVSDGFVKLVSATALERGEIVSMVAWIGGSALSAVGRVHDLREGNAAVLRLSESGARIDRLV